jgi:hypothetical protein
MNRPILITGLLIIVAMITVPPNRVETFNDGMADMADIAGTGQPRSEFVETKVVYSPAWRKVGEKAGYRDRELEGKEVETARLAVQRLLLQIVVVVVLAGGLAAVIGSKE